MVNDYIVKDSSIWLPPSPVSDKQQNGLYFGQVVEVSEPDDEYGENIYIVYVNRNSTNIPVSCRRLMNQCGGIYNYQEIINQGYVESDNSCRKNIQGIKAGDHVVVSFLNGNSSKGVILGFLHHSGRKRELDSSLGPQYKTRFNGFETYINSDGEMLWTFNGQPMNLKELESEPGSRTIPEPEFDEEIGGSCIFFAKDGSIKIRDKKNEETSDYQEIQITKNIGISIVSGKIKIEVLKEDESVNFTCKSTKFTIEDLLEIKSKEVKIESSSITKIKSPKIAIGSAGVNLIDEIVKLITELGTIVLANGGGATHPINAAPTWVKIIKIQTALKGIKGDL